MTIEYETRLFINNEFVPSVSGKTFDTVNPATEQVICSVYEAEAADVDKAVRRRNRCGSVILATILTIPSHYT
jgi:acyl-CoA reductase-like NAD-dependent aldehyde dehydrogenase